MPKEAIAKIAGKDEGYLFPTAFAGAKASYYRTTSDHQASLAMGNSDPPITQTTEWLSAHAAGHAGSYTGLDAAAHIVSAEDKHTRVKLGAGVSTGVGIKDGSLKGKILGCGVSVGKEIGFSLFDNEFTLKLTWPW